MKLIVSGVIGAAFCIYVTYSTVVEWLTHGVITVYGKGIPDFVFSGNNLLMGAAINISFALACFLLTIGFPLFDHDLDAYQSLGIKTLYLAGMLLLTALALSLYAFYFIYVPPLGEN